jgi:membrane fusion protein
MVAGLFRREAVESRQNDWLGSVQLVRPVSLTFLTAAVVIAALAIAALLVEGRYTRKARVAGFLVPDRGVIRLLPPQAGTVLESHVAEGTAVHAGDVLFVLGIDQATPAGETVQNSVSMRERSLKGAAQQQVLLQQSQATATEQRLNDMRRELAALLAEADLQAQRLTLAQQAQTRLESLRDENFVSAAQVQAKAEEVLGLRAQVQNTERQRATQLREIGTLEAQQRELPLRSQAQRGEIDRDLALLAQQTAEKQSRQRIVVRAAQDGVISAVLAEPGQSVLPTSALASLVPADSRLQAHLFAPSSAVGFLRAHQAVMLRFDAFPYQKFGHQLGQVLQVSRAPLQAAELAGLPLQGGPGTEPLYRVTVALDRQTVEAYGEAQPLSPGMQLEGDVQLDRRRLIEWIFEPVLGLAGKV